MKLYLFSHRLPVFSLNKSCNTANYIIFFYQISKIYLKGFFSFIEGGYFSNFARSYTSTNTAPASVYPVTGMKTHMIVGIHCLFLQCRYSITYHRCLLAIVVSCSKCSCWWTPRCDSIQHWSVPRLTGTHALPVLGRSQAQWRCHPSHTTYVLSPPLPGWICALCLRRISGSFGTAAVLYCAAVTENINLTYLCQKSYCSK